MTYTPDTTELELPPAITKERMAELAPKLRTNNLTKEESQEIWLGHARLALKIASRYQKLWDNEELREVALLAIGTAIKQAPGKLQDDNFDRFCGAKVKSKIIQLIGERPRAQEERSDERTTPTPEQVRADKVLESVLDMVNDEQEREIISLRIAGYSDREIGEKLGIKRKAVMFIRHRIHRQYLAEMQS